MADERQILDLVEAALDSGQTPEQVCTAHPELLEQVRGRYAAARQVEAQLDAIFPSSGATRPISSRRRVPAADLPRIPGYRVESLLGHGGMGVVYRAHHLGLRRDVALKMLLSGAYASPSELSRFLREAEAIAGLRHPNIVQVYDLGDFNGRPFFTMEFMSGGHLGRKLDGTPLPAPDAAALLETLASAVDVAHRAGIVHRDLKPANILLSDDGTPKIADFGLACRVEGDDLLTRSGARVGTPSYMAPEQVSSHKGSAGPAADVYSLGAVLYEMLAGRPPFIGESVSETERQLLANDPVPPSRLNTRVPRDLETICLACLRKDPAKRYASAAELADDLRRFRVNEPIKARATGRAERAAKWVRRHPTFATALAGAAAVAISLIVGLSWLASQRAAVDRAVRSDLAEAVAFQRAAEWPAAAAALDRAGFRLGGRGGLALRSALARARADQAHVARLDALRMLHGDPVGNRMKFVEANQGYAEEFFAGGFGSESEPPPVVAARVVASNVRLALVGALDDWIQCSPSSERARWILAVARAADADPTGWRDRLRDPAVWEDGPALARAVADAPLAGQPAPFLLSVATRLRGAKQDTRAFLARVRLAHPDDFWANLAVADACRDVDRGVSIGYLQAAVSLRPTSAVARNGLVSALMAAGRHAEAIEEIKEAVRIDPAAWLLWGNYALCLADDGRREEAVAVLDDGIAHNPACADLRRRRAEYLLALGRSDAAMGGYWDAVDVDPDYVDGWKSLISGELRLGRWDDLLARWQKFLARDPANHPAWNCFAELNLFLGRERDYRQLRTKLLARFGNASDPHVCERVGRACLLLPGTPAETSLAAALVDRALAARDPAWEINRPYFMYAKGIAEYRLGHYAEAIRIMEGEAGHTFIPGPWLVLAASRARLGQVDAARYQLSNAAVALDWSRRAATDPDTWILHVLRREAEPLAAPNLDLLLTGKAVPRDNKDRFMMLPSVEFADREVASARLWANSISRNPAIAQDHALDAVRASALAGVGRGSDTADATAADRAAFRANALEWATADLERLRAATPDNDDAVKRVRARIEQWLSASDLQYVRSPEHLAKLPDPERAAWTTFWSDLKTAIQKFNPKK